MTSNEDLAKARELLSTVSEWVDKSFNYVNLSNVEKVFDNMLFEYIETNQTEETAEEFLSQYGYEGEYRDSDYESALEFVRDRYEDDFAEYADQDHYPMWSTLFEFRHSPSRETLNAARKAGFGIINESEDYQAMLFVKGAGYSFYGAHWIPMYLNLPWVDQDKYQGIDYSSL